MASKIIVKLVVILNKVISYMAIQESKYSKKSTVREMIFGAYFAGEIGAVVL